MAPPGRGEQAGLAVGLTLAIEKRLPQFAPELVTVILSAVIIFEIIGPFGVRWSVVRAGEAHPEGDQSLSAISSPSAPSS